MARRSLRPHLNQIRSWVRQGRTDAWIAHQLEVTVQQIEAFKKENDLLPDGEASLVDRPQGQLLYMMCGVAYNEHGGNLYDDADNIRVDDRTSEVFVC